MADSDNRAPRSRVSKEGDPSLRIRVRPAPELTLEQRREVPGLHPDRAPTIVAGVLIFEEILRIFGLQRVEISEHDILRGAALELGGGSG